MTTQIAVRLPDEIVEFLDQLVAQGDAKSRAAAVTRALELTGDGEWLSGTLRSTRPARIQTWIVSPHGPLRTSTLAILTSAADSPRPAR